MPITRFPFSSGCFRYRMAVGLLRRCCDSIQCGIKSATIRAFRNWSRKRNREPEKISPNEKALAPVAGAAPGRLRWRGELCEPARIRRAVAETFPELPEGSAALQRLNFLLRSAGFTL